MFGIRHMAAFSPRRRNLNGSKFFSKISSSSLPDIPGDVFRSSLEVGEVNRGSKKGKESDKDVDFYEVMANCMLEEVEEEEEDVGEKEQEKRDRFFEKYKIRNPSDKTFTPSDGCVCKRISSRNVKKHTNEEFEKTKEVHEYPRKIKEVHEFSEKPNEIQEFLTENEASQSKNQYEVKNINIDTSKMENLRNENQNTEKCSVRNNKKTSIKSSYVGLSDRSLKIVSPVRDRSRVGNRGSLPFTNALGLASGASSSGVSSGSSDTQSQGSGGDSKSDSPTPEGSRKNVEASSSSSSSSSSGVVSGVSLRCAKGHELPVTAGARESAALRQEVETLRNEITKARQTILHMQEREKKLKDRLGDRASRGVERGSGRIENLNLGERRPSALVRRYGNLYAQARVDTLDALDSLPDLKNAEELKSKLLFSVVVLAFRSASSSAATLKEEVRRVMQVPPPPCKGDGHDKAHDAQSLALELAISSYITTTIDKHDLTKNVDEVCQQIWATLYDYPTLKACEGLLQYIKDCVRLAWGLSNQTPPFAIDYESRKFKKEYHVRFHTADPEKDIIKTYLWPALVEGPGGACVQKGVVIT